nr:hypothetical protein [uncultured Sphaerochaeta sp.]
MKANEDFSDMKQDFWAYVRLLTESLGYSSNNLVKTYDISEIIQALKRLGINISEPTLHQVKKYFDYRATLLNTQVRSSLMNATEASEQFSILKTLHLQSNYSCDLPMNKQKGDMRQYAYFTCIANILAERTLREYCTENGLVYGIDIFFDDDPRKLSYLTNDQDYLEAVFSRRFDGAFPATKNPILVWEIKEYYYNKSFGSRIADGVYETQLDGYELNEMERSMKRKISHIYLVDSYHTWWILGKSYLCRIIDTLNMGLVDDVIFGKEIFTHWPQIIKEALSMNNNYSL